MGGVEFQRIVASLHAPPYENSLECLNPRIAGEWNYGRNAPLTPAMLTPKSRRRVWWKCQKGHEWQAAIASRTTQDTHCRVCSRRVVSSDYNLATERPDVASIWRAEMNSPLRPEDVSPGTKRAVWWRCERCGEAFRRAVQTQCKSEPLCLDCSYEKRAERTRTSRLINGGSLLVRAPQLTAEWHPAKNGKLRPQDLARFSGKPVWWRCRDCGHDWRMSPIARRACPSCKAPMLSD